MSNASELLPLPLTPVNTTNWLRGMVTSTFLMVPAVIAALMVFTHQAHMINLLIRASWEARAADPALHPPFTATAEEMASLATVLRGVANEVVDYLLFVDEAPLADPVVGSSSFTQRFSSSGPRDKKGRSLYELELQTRLLKYRCSYLVYSPSFDALPAAIKTPIYERLWQVLSGEARDARYTSALPRAERQAIVEILRDEGIEIARRTVAKYREALRIPSSVQRRREKTLRI